MKTGQIIEGRGGLYTVAEDNGDIWVLRAMNKLRRANLTPLVGDLVRFTPGTGEEHGWLTDILPRTSYCLRPPVANIDLLCLTVAPTPQPDWLLVDKVLLFARMQHIIPLLVVNKCDLSEDAYQDARACTQRPICPCASAPKQDKAWIRCIRPCRGTCAASPGNPAWAKAA